MKHRRALLYFLIYCFGGFIECGVSVVATAQPTGVKMATRVITANNQFGFDLFQHLQTKDPGANLFVSPLSVAFALAMTYN